MTVLLVDDEPEVLNIHRLILINIGCKVITARNGHEAFKTFELNPDAIDLIVTDYDMPVWNGLKLIRAVRNQNDVVPILMVTGFAGYDIIKEAGNLGIDILQKPVRTSALVEAIRACGRHHIKNCPNHSELQDTPLRSTA